jgi:hypothetical protein
MEKRKQKPLISDAMNRIPTDDPSRLVVGTAFLLSMFHKF